MRKSFKVITQYPRNNIINKAGEYFVHIKKPEEETQVNKRQKPTHAQRTLINF